MNLGEVRAAIPTLGNVVPLFPQDPQSVPGQAQPIASAVLPKGPDGTVMLPAGKWCKYAGKLGAGLTVVVSAASIRSGGHEPNDPDDDDCKLLQEALEEGLRLRFGDGPVPWWLGAALAAGGVYAGMRIGARKIEKRPVALVTDGQRENPVAEPATVPVVSTPTGATPNKFGFAGTPDINPTVSAKQD